MKTVGQILREARESKGISVAQAAERTHSKSQIILALEQDDYSRFPAPIYTRGFIKLYAELLGLDAPELISLYQARNSETDKLQRPSSVLRPGSSHTSTPPPNVTPELDLPPPAPVPESAALPVSPVPVPPPAPVTPELELPFDQPMTPPKAASAAAGAPSAPTPPPRPFPKPLPPLPPPPPKPAPVPPRVQPPSTPEPPKVAPILPEAPSRPVANTELPPSIPPAVPRLKATMGKGLPSTEFDLVGKPSSSVARQRAASILATAQASAGRLPWRKILIRTAAVACIGFFLWLLLSLFRGCVNRPALAPVPGEGVPFAPHAVPEPPPLYFPESTPGR